MKDSSSKREEQEFLDKKAEDMGGEPAYTVLTEEQKAYKIADITKRMSKALAIRDMDEYTFLALEKRKILVGDKEKK